MTCSPNSPEVVFKFLFFFRVSKPYITPSSVGFFGFVLCVSRPFEVCTMVDDWENGFDCRSNPGQNVACETAGGVTVGGALVNTGGANLESRGRPLAGADAGVRSRVTHNVQGSSGAPVLPRHPPSPERVRASSFYC